MKANFFESLLSEEVIFLEKHLLEKRIDALQELAENIDDIESEIDEDEDILSFQGVDDGFDEFLESMMSDEIITQEVAMVLDLSFKLENHLFLPDEIYIPMKLKTKNFFESFDEIGYSDDENVVNPEGDNGGGDPTLEVDYDELPGDEDDDCDDLDDDDLFESSGFGSHFVTSIFAKSDPKISTQMLDEIFPSEDHDPTEGNALPFDNQGLVVESFVLFEEFFGSELIEDFVSDLNRDSTVNTGLEQLFKKGI